MDSQTSVFHVVKKMRAKLSTICEFTRTPPFLPWARLTNVLIAQAKMTSIHLFNDSSSLRSFRTKRTAFPCRMISIRVQQALLIRRFHLSEKHTSSQIYYEYILFPFIDIIYVFLLQPT